MKIIDQITIYENPNPLLVSRQAIFPGVLELPDGDLMAMFAIGQAFDSADQLMHVSKSSDYGRSWSAPRPIHNHHYEPFQKSESFKPLLLSNGILLAVGYVFVRPDAETPIVHPDTFKTLALKNMITNSSDNGQTWKLPRKIDIEGVPLELSGPCIQLASGRIIGAASPFHLNKTGHSGWIIFSDDAGEHWAKLSEFFKSEKGEVAAWECRLIEMEPDQIAVVFWAYDALNQKNLTNRIVFSNDGGKHFSAAVDTCINAQASNLMWLGGGEVLTIHSHREAPVGLKVRRVDISGGRFSILEEINLFSDDKLGSNTEDIRKQFGSLKFGQPSLLRLTNGEVLATCWAFESYQHVIKGFFLEI
jgi:sialidase-1